MSDYCCGVKQANKQCVWLCNGSIQTFLCVCEAPCEVRCVAIKQREPVFDKQPNARLPEKSWTVWDQRKLDVQLRDRQTDGRFRVHSHIKERLTAFGGFLKSWDIFYTSCVKTLCHLRGIDSPGRWGINFAWFVRWATFQNDKKILCVE